VTGGGIIRNVTLEGGPSDGTVLATDGWSVYQGPDAVYVQSDDDSSKFLHLDRILKAIRPKQRKRERSQVKQWMIDSYIERKADRAPTPAFMALPEIPLERIRAHQAHIEAEFITEELEEEKKRAKERATIINKGDEDGTVPDTSNGG
jgi:hypothetical protein